MFTVMGKNLGNHQLLGPIGKGGMGEVFLARDNKCGRQVALKKMLGKWEENKTMRNRFLREALIAAQLSHPNIIPIYSIDETALYYTMPHIEGETLKEIIKATKDQLKNGEPLHPIGGSVPTLIRIFHSVLSAIAYCHDRGVLHRDLKPENIIVGKYGEVIILDWGLANYIDQPEATGELDTMTSNGEITQPGKIPGTLLYMAPERAFGAKSSVSTDIYSLGVTLYQLLTLQFPFKRGTLKEYKKLADHERILDPEEAAPDREIVPHLSRIVRRALAKKPEDRYPSVDALMKDLEGYTEGNPEWLGAGELRVGGKEDWIFQENIPFAPHRALSRDIDHLEWANTMISRAHYPGNIRIEGKVVFEDDEKGVDILFCIPDDEVQKALDRAYRICLSPTSVRLFRAGVEVAFAEIPKMHKRTAYAFVMEKQDNQIRFSLEGVPRLSYLSHIPLTGSQVGLSFKGGSEAIEKLSFFVGSKNITVNCLAVPDAFLDRGEFQIALEEYRKISYSFPGRAEGREATFRAGLTLLRQASAQKQKGKQNTFFSLAFDEFSELRGTPGAPLELLGKSLIYKAQEDVEEEVKYLELALRKYPAHPLKPILVENILSRLFETAQTFREGAFRFALLVLQHLPKVAEAHNIYEMVKNHLEPLPFFSPSENKNTHITIQLAFWLNRPMLLVEMLEKGLDFLDGQNAQVALLLLGHEAGTAILKEPTLPLRYAHFFYLLKEEQDPRPALTSASPAELTIWSALLEENFEQAGKMLSEVSEADRQDPKSLFFFLHCCYLAKKEGEDAAKAYAELLSPSPNPPITSLLGHFLSGHIDMDKGWIKTALPWEEFSLYQQLSLFKKCLKK